MRVGLRGTFVDIFSALAYSFRSLRWISKDSSMSQGAIIAEELSIGACLALSGWEHIVVSRVDGIGIDNQQDGYIRFWFY
jgi:hypothetical protein